MRRKCLRPDGRDPEEQGEGRVSILDLGTHAICSFTPMSIIPHLPSEPSEAHIWSKSRNWVQTSTFFLNSSFFFRRSISCFHTSVFSLWDSARAEMTLPCASIIPSRAFNCFARTPICSIFSFLSARYWRYCRTTPRIAATAKAVEIRSTSTKSTPRDSEWNQETMRFREISSSAVPSYPHRKTR